MSRWTGPRDGELNSVNTLLVSLPPERWPFCEPQHHDSSCYLRAKNGAAGSYCDCFASDAGDEDEQRAEDFRQTVVSTRRVTGR